MSKTQAERAKAYRQRRRDENVTVKRDVTECDGPSVTGADLHEVGSAADLIEQCIKRAAAGKHHRDGDPAWPYTSHLIPSDFAAWCKVHKPSWLTSAEPGDIDYADGLGQCHTCGVETPCLDILKCTACCLTEWARPAPRVMV